MVTSAQELVAPALAGGQSSALSSILSGYLTAPITDPHVICLCPATKSLLGFRVFQSGGLIEGQGVGVGIDVGVGVKVGTIT